MVARKRLPGEELRPLDIIAKFMKNIPHGYVFVSNVPDNTPKLFADVAWKTKRKIKPAYDVDGKVLADHSAVIVQRTELDQAGFTIITD